MKVTIYTDGSSRGNPGPGGWAAIILTEGKQDGDEVIELGGGEVLTTNNRMELTGAIEGLKAISGQSVDSSQIHSDSENLQPTTYKLRSVEVCTDSEYVKKGMTAWIDGWIQKGWKTSTKKDVLNKDLWQALKHEEDRLKHHGVHVTWKYVQAHVGIPLNERADTIATTCADTFTTDKKSANDLQLFRGSKQDYQIA
jgi:ribonuclease HI